MEASAIRDALVTELAKVEGVKTVTGFLPQTSPDLLPTLLLWRTRGSQVNSGVGNLIVNRSPGWALIIRVALQDYEEAQTELETIWDRVLDRMHKNDSLGALVREWKIEDDGDDPTFDETRGVYEKWLTISVTTEEPTNF